MRICLVFLFLSDLLLIMLLSSLHWRSKPGEERTQLNLNLEQLKPTEDQEFSDFQDHEQFNEPEARLTNEKWLLSPRKTSGAGSSELRSSQGNVFEDYDSHSEFAQESMMQFALRESEPSNPQTQKEPLCMRSPFFDFHQDKVLQSDDSLLQFEPGSMMERLLKEASPSIPQTQEEPLSMRPPFSDFHPDKVFENEGSLLQSDPEPAEPGIPPARTEPLAIRRPFSDFHQDKMLERLLKGLPPTN